MIALLTTYLILAYILVPGVLFRVFAGFLVKLRLFQLTKTQEFTVSALVCVLPFCTATAFVWNVPFAQQIPLAYSFGDFNQYGSDYRIGLSLIFAPDPQKLLDSHQGPKTAYEEALARIWRRQVRFLFWYYLFGAGEGVLFGFLASKYGDWSERSSLYDWVARKILLPHVSEWQLLLTDFTWPKHPKRDVIADVLCNDILYRGKVSDYFIDANGKLSGIFMTDAERFRREDFKAACEKAKSDAVQLYAVDRLANEALRTERVDIEQFWRQIPGSNFYIPADKISNLNIHFPSENPLQDQALEAYLTTLLEEADVPGTTITFDAVDAPTQTSAPTDRVDDVTKDQNVPGIEDSAQG